MLKMGSKYVDWTREALIERIVQLEKTIQQSGSSAPKFHKQKSKGQRPIDFSKYSTRKIALRFSYLGWNYNGLAVQKDPTPLPTVEGVILQALEQCRLISDASNPQGCEFSRCGRTDRGVSAMNQVISLRVRSNLTQEEQGVKSNDPREIDYLNILNCLLPKDIKIHSICLRPVEGFDARFSCISRHYKYIFHGERLDIAKMEEAAHHYVGEHDFRNFCKLDGSKQITNYKRTMLQSRILELNNGFYCFDLEGSAFLWHQVRNMVAVLFLVGQGLESPGVVRELLDVSHTFPTKPVFEMASDLPLVLYDCKFPEMEWIEAIEGTKNDCTNTTIYSNWLELQIRSQISTMMLEKFRAESKHSNNAIRINLGDGKGRVMAQYVPLDKRELHESYEVINERFNNKKQRTK